MSSEFPCISMNLISRARYSSGIQSPVSTWPPDWTYSRNSCVRASTMWPPYRTVVSIECNGYQARGADPRGGPALRGARVPRDVDGRARAGARRPEGLAVLAHRFEAGAPVSDHA